MRPAHTRETFFTAFFFLPHYPTIQAALLARGHQLHFPQLGDDPLPPPDLLQRPASSHEQLAHTRPR